VTQAIREGGNPVPGHWIYRPFLLALEQSKWQPKQRP